jgi:hypothetical protein
LRAIDPGRSGWTLGAISTILAVLTVLPVFSVFSRQTLRALRANWPLRSSGADARVDGSDIGINGRHRRGKPRQGGLRIRKVFFIRLLAYDLRKCQGVGGQNGHIALQRAHVGPCLVHSHAQGR